MLTIPISPMPLHEETDTFYCSDPAEGCAQARVPASDAIIELEDVDVVWYVTSPSKLNPPVQAEKENDSEEAAAEQSLIPAIEIAPVTGVDSLDKTELKLEMS